MHPLPNQHPASTDAAPEVSQCPYQRAAQSLRRTPRSTLTRPIDGISEPTPGTLVLVGVDHHTAPVELRERFNRGGELSTMLVDLRSLGLPEAVILFTCNRFEVYATVGDVGTSAIVNYLAARCDMSPADLLPSLYRSEGRDAAMHLMRVASGLESIVLGEPQILGQVSDALTYAQECDAAGATLTRLFTSATHAGKRARTETGIGRHTLSISHAAVLLLKSAVDLSAARVLVIGAGEMASLAVDALQSHGVGSVRVVNRTPARMGVLCDRFGITGSTLDGLSEMLSDCDAVIAATSSPLPLITAADFATKPAEKIIELIDLSVPRNIDPTCAETPGIRLHDVDSLQQVVESHRLHRQREAAHVERLLESELADYLDWIHSRKATPLISDLHRRASQVMEAEIACTLRRLPNLDEQEKAAVIQMAHRIVGKLLHSPTMALKSREGADEFADAVRRLYALEANIDEPGSALAAGGRDA